MLTQAIKNEGTLLLRGALDALSVAAFALNSFGKVVSFSEKAECLFKTRHCSRLGMAIWNVSWRKIPPSSIAR